MILEMLLCLPPEGANLFMDWRSCFFIQYQAWRRFFSCPKFGAKKGSRQNEHPKMWKNEQKLREK